MSFLSTHTHTHTHTTVGEFDNAGGMMTVDSSLLCSFQILKPADKKSKYRYGGPNAERAVTPLRAKNS